ncbi:membrane-bound lytic murein transglycosylase B [Desulfotignum phosphitoxidans DSM 13687]|jgi:membrane-bound lytic murein transglycosylase B|uniref:Membrane-bound lytic murein transglycosylase B n=2 Tax=Desulfobacteraceae TaxID=213119 RepID=S0FTW4_9BACT|nr:membrane-bound lytic murein transglycosylase B [Desulfotignum phosphitoxidans DSM 13687]
MEILPDIRAHVTRCFFFMLVLFCLAPCVIAQQPAAGNEFDALKQRLIKDGFAPEKIQNILTKDTVSFSPAGVSMFFVHSESSLNYDQFLSKDSIANAFQYMADHKKALDQAQEIYGVDKTVITAILLVETRLGNYLGNQTVINTLATMASLTDETLRERIWNAIPDQKKPEKDTFLKKVTLRAKWGYEELKALIRYTDREGVDPKTIRGSYAGAMGIPQFMPSNALTLAKDGNNDDSIDLFDHSDAIFSVANYLKHHGWDPGISRQRQHEVLFRYNHSNYYVDTLMKISDRLKEG